MDESKETETQDPASRAPRPGQNGQPTSHAPQGQGEAGSAAQGGGHTPGTDQVATGLPFYTPPPDPYLGTTIAGRYYVEKLLGEGGMGSVYLARHIALDKRVALKILHSPFVRKPEIVERFLQEAKAASRIEHDNVIDITDFGSTPEGTVFFAMEVLEGQDLHDVITQAKRTGKPLPWARIRNIFLQVSAALAAAHDKGVIHRDLKPENIYLVERRGHKDVVKLLDFGIAKLVEFGDSERKLTRTGMLFGTPEYMSPEQARGDKIDHRVDVYATGCLLYQLVTGRVPFISDNFMSVLSMHMAEEPPPIAPADLQATGAPPGIERVIRTALAKDREERYATMQALSADILALGEPGPAEPARPAGVRLSPLSSSSPPRRGAALTPDAMDVMVDVLDEPAPRPPRSRLKWVVAGLVVVAIGAGGALWVVRQNMNMASAPDTTNELAGTEPGVFTILPGQGADQAAEPGLVTLRLVTTPQGARVLDENDAILGHTPFVQRLPRSQAARRLRLVLDGYRDEVVALVPDTDMTHFVTLQAAGAALPGTASSATGSTSNSSAGSRHHEHVNTARAGSNDSQDRASTTASAPDVKSDAQSDTATRSAGTGATASKEPAEVELKEPASQKERDTSQSSGTSTSSSSGQEAPRKESTGQTRTSPNEEPVLKNPFGK